MSTKPKRLFNFPLSILLTESGKLHTALAKPGYTAALNERLGASAAVDFEGAIELVNREVLSQSGQSGESGTLTQEQNDALFDMRRLTAGARRSAGLALKGQTVVLHDEFQLGQSEGDASLGAEVMRAQKTHAAALKYATALQTQAWIPSDATALGVAVGILEKASLDQSAALADGVEFTAVVTNAANALYNFCLRVQNAVRLHYPLPRPGAVIPSEIVGARSSFLLESFPPRDRNTPDGGVSPVPPAV